MAPPLSIAELDLNSELSKYKAKLFFSPFVSKRDFDSDDYSSEM